jgi:hypothetical protein
VVLMRIEVVIKRLSVKGFTVRSRETLRHMLSSAIARQLEASLDAGGTPASLREDLHIKHVSAPALRVSGGPGLDARIARGAARRFCASLGNATELHAEPAHTSPALPGSRVRNGLRE